MSPFPTAHLMDDGFMTDLLMTVAEAAERLRCTQNHVYQLINLGRLKATNLSTDERPRWRITESALQTLLQGNND